MANDRIQIKCAKCGSWKMLAAFDGLRLHADPAVLDWINEHGTDMCRPDFSGDLCGNPGFSLHTDDDIAGALDLDRQGKPPKDE